MDYGIVIPLITFIVGIQAVIKFDLRPITGALISVGIPFVISGLIGWIIAGSRMTSIWGDAVSLVSLLTFLIQLPLMFLLLRYLEKTDSVAAYILSIILGFIVVVLLTPSIVTKIL